MGTRVRGGERKQFPVPPEGLWQGVCADAWDIWTEPRPERWGGGVVDKTRLVWQVNKVNKETGKPYEASQVYTASLFDKAKLRAHLEAWRGRKFTKEELAEFELERLIGANCQLQIVHNLGSDGITYANVQAIVPLAKGMVPMRVSADFVRKKDRTKVQPDDQGGPGAPADDDDVPF